MTERFKKIADSAWFQNFITAVIVLAGVVVGAETYPALVSRHEGFLHLMNQLILWIFVAEIVVKIGAEGSRPWRYFLDPWNIFDFAIVAICFMPFDAQYVAVLRLARLLRVLKLVTAVPRLQVLVSTLLNSIPSMFYVSVLLFLMFYLYACAAVFIFGENDPIHFGNLQIAHLSLFRAVTLEDWTDLMYIQMFGCENYGYDGNEALCTASVARPVTGALFFVSFVLLGTMVVMNLFIGVIMNSMADAEKEQAIAARDHDGAPTLEDEIALLQEQLEEMKSRLDTIGGLATRRRDRSA
jgi:voltage-gated sodium channel